jgi:hypothetical protein
MVGNSSQLDVTVTFRDGHTENVASQARYETDGEGVIEIRNGRLIGIGEGTARVRVFYTDPMGNELRDEFTVRSTFFPFGKEYITTNLFSEGTYNESTHTFKTGQYGQMGWVYSNGADMSAYKYLVVKLKQTASGAHLNIFTDNSIWASNHETAAFGSKKQIVVNLSTAKYTNGDKKGQPLDTKNIRIVDFWGDRVTIVVDDMYLTNNSDYTPQAIESPQFSVHSSQFSVHSSQFVYDLQGRRVAVSSTFNLQSSMFNGQSSMLKKGLYIVNGRKVVK